MESADSILNSLGVESKDGIIKYKESQLTSLFGSPLAIEEIVGNRIEGFEGVSEEGQFKLILVKYWFVFAMVFIGIVLFFVWKKQKYILAN